jgi:hypothetical protein
VFSTASDAVVAVSGRKDSMAALALVAESDADHRALHFDWGRRFIPREVVALVFLRPADVLYLFGMTAYNARVAAS